MVKSKIAVQVPILYTILSSIEDSIQVVSKDILAAMEVIIIVFVVLLQVIHFYIFQMLAVMSNIIECFVTVMDACIS